MADYIRYDVTTVERLYVLHFPTNWVEVGKVLNALERELGDQDADDRVTVEAEDDEIRFRYVLSHKRGATS